METIEYLKNLNFYELFVGIVAIVLAFQFLYKTFVEDIIQKHGWETRKMRQRREAYELLLKTAENLAELQKKHNDDNNECLKHDEMIREDLQMLTITINEIREQIDTMQKKSDATEMAKLKDKILAYYRKYSKLDEWQKFEADVFWGLYDRYIQHGGNSFVKNDIEPVMRNLKEID